MKLRVFARSSGPGGTAQLNWLPPAAPMLADAIDAVKNSDVAVVFVGLNPTLEGEEMNENQPGFLGGDRTEINLPETQENLVKAAIGTGKPVIVVLTSGSAIAANYAAEHATRPVELWYGGGRKPARQSPRRWPACNNPGGRLPVTFYKGVDQTPPVRRLFHERSALTATSKAIRSTGFGYGLSFSTFQYSGLKAQRTAKGAQSPYGSRIAPVRG